MPDILRMAGTPRGALDSEQFFRILLDKIPDGVYFVDKQRYIRFWNLTAEQLTGYPFDRVVGTCCADNVLMHVDDQGRSLCQHNCPLVATMGDGRDRDVHVFLHHCEGHRIPVRVRTTALRDGFGDIIGAIETFTDDTTYMTDLQRIRQLEQFAFLDDLTGLANRRYLQEVFKSRMAEATRFGSRFGVMLADVDFLKSLNDRYGHDTGDRMLQVVARTLAHNCRAYDIVGRWGGDEFLFVTGSVTAKDLYQLAERLRVLVGQSKLTACGESLCIEISIGATMAKKGDELDGLLSRADKALYRSKASGRNRVTFEG